MYLKALEMQGFKSFPDKTVLNFETGITGVVGPNGSGKSNIADAVRWVLGEQSTKSLRGAKMEDVIFSGTKDRRAVGFAEVTLRLDNSDGALHNPEKEVSVTRRYYRSGDSAYIINGKTVRLRDVNELFMDTGLGRDGYSMVGQGKIEELVSAKSENRRDMFEEAAGISHYRYRRADAVKRLNQTEENLVRLRDIVSELESRVGPLEKQSRKAQQFLVYAAERKELEIGLWLNTLERSAAQIREQITKIGIAEAQYDAVERELTALSEAIDGAAEETREINVRIEAIHRENSAVEEEAAALEREAAVYETSVSHNLEAAEELRERIRGQETDENALKEEQAALEEQIAELEKSSAEAAAEAEKLTAKLGNLRSEDEAYSDEYNAVNEALSALTLKISQTQIMQSAGSSSAEEIRSRLREAADREAQLAEEKAALKKQEEKEAGAVAGAEEALTSMQNAAAGFQLRLRRAEEKTQAAKDAYEDKKLAFLQNQSRLKFLEDTEKNMEGYGGSVKRVMKDREGRRWLCFHTQRALERHDGLQFEAVNAEGRHLGLGIAEMYAANPHRPAFAVDAGTDVEILLPEPVDGRAGDEWSALQPGSGIFCSMSNAVKRMFPAPSFRPSGCEGLCRIDVEVDLRRDGIACRVVSPFAAEAAAALPLEPAKTPERTREAVRRTFEKLGGTDYALGDLAVNDPDGLFAPMSALNALRRELVERLDATRSSEREARVSAALDSLSEPPDSAVDAGEPPMCTLKLRLGQKVPAGDWDEIIVAIDPDDFDGGMLAGLRSGAQTRLSLPVYTAEPDFSRLRTLVKRLVREGFAKWEASDLATLRLLRSVGIADATADWTLAAFNSQALAALSELGVRRFVASPENSRANLRDLSESGYHVEFLAQQSTPLFISLTKPEAEPDAIGGGLTYFNRGGLWITTRDTPRTFEVPDKSPSRVDLSWDFA